MHRVRVLAAFVFAWIWIGALGWAGVHAATLTRAAADVPAAISADGPPQRSTVFDFASRITYTADVRFNRNAAMTIEAWVYPERNFDDPAGCQTLVEHHLGTSYWFGMCPKLRFHRSDGNFVESSAELQTYRWTHVAVSYDGATATFYMNGEAVGSAALATNVPLVAHSLGIGGSESAGAYYRGRIDEIRLWSVARSAEEIRGGMFQQLRSGTGLEATFGDGGRNEDLQGVAGTLSGASQPDILGVLPRGLVVPRAAVTPTLNADVNTAVEYAGAEQVAARYSYTGSSAYGDQTAHLVRTDSDLFVGITYATLAGSDWRVGSSYIGLMLDPNLSGEPLAQADDYQIRVYLQGPWDDGVPATAQLYKGDGAGNWVLCSDPACPQRGTDWDADTRLVGETPPGQPVEIRVAKSILGEWTEVDGLAVGQFDLDTSLLDAIGPVQAVENSPLTWGQVVYSEGSAQLPQAVVRGKVYAGPDSTFPPLAGHTVVFGDFNSSVFQQVTDANGEFAFDVRVPVNTQLRLQIQSCTNCRYATATTSGAGIAPTNVGGTFLFFPGCAAGTTCSYRDTQFYVRQPPGPTLVSATAPQARMKINTAGEVTPETFHILTGENLHDLIDVYLSVVPDNSSTRKDIDNWTLFKADVITRSADMKSMKVRVPTLDRTVRKQNGGPMVGTLGGNWRWVVKDGWQRPDNFDGFRVSGSFRLRQPEYPTIFGFGFKNEDEGASLDQFLATYGDNAYICVGAFGLCLTHIPDPLYWAVWYPVFKIWINASGGSCVGMASTSLLFYHGNLNIANYSSDAFFPAGIKDRGAPADWDYGTFGKAFGPPKAGNLWAEIRKNHGVQTSAEFLYEAVNQLDGFSGDPTQRLFYVRASPNNFVASMMKLGGGHAVTPYATSGNRIHIYDNNFPRTTGQFIDVDTAANTYSSSTSFSGTGLFAIDIDVWRDERSMPLDLPAIAMNLIFGQADALYTDTNGKQWGWQADGTFVDEIPDATPFVPMGSETNTHNVPLFVPLTSTVVSNVQVNTQGGGYLYYTGLGGNAVQLQVLDAPAGDQDRLEVKTAQSQVNGFSYQPESPSDEFVPKLGSDLGEQQRLLFRWGDLATPGGGKLAFTTNPTAKSADYVNSTGISTTHYLVVDSIDGRDGIEKASTRRFGPFEVPNGATQRTTIVDWSDGSQLRSELDLDGDGVFDRSETVTGRSCASEDVDEDGIPDACEGSGGLYLPLIVKAQ